MSAKEKSAFEIFMKELGKESFSALDLRKEHELLQLAEKGDVKAQEKIIKANLRYVVSVAKNFANKGSLLDDLIQVGSIALFESFQSFNYEKFLQSGCNRFISYASKRVIQKISLEVKKSLPVSITDGKFKELKKLQTEMKNLGIDNLDESALELLSKNVGISKKKIKNLYKISLDTFSLEQTSDYDGKSLEDRLGDTFFSTPEEESIKKVMSEEVKKNLSSLSRTEEDVLTLAYGLDKNEPLNYPAIGKKLGYTREGIRLIHNRAINHLRKNMDFAA